MRVLIACEFSGTVRDAFIHLGHEAVSCDLLPSESPGAHYQGNVIDITPPNTRRGELRKNVGMKSSNFTFGKVALRNESCLLKPNT